MSIPKNKVELVSEINLNFNKLYIQLNELSSEDSTKKELCGHRKETFMSLNNLASYLIGWAELVIKWDNNRLNNKEIVFPEVGYKWNEIGLLAQKFYTDYQDLSYEKLLERLIQSKDEILCRIDQYDNDLLYHIPFYKHYPLGRMIQLNTSSPYKNALKRIKTWQKKQKIQ